MFSRWKPRAHETAFVLREKRPGWVSDRIGGLDKGDFGAGEGARTLDPDLGKVVPPRCAMLRAFADLPQIPVITCILRCWFLLLFAPICANLLAIC